MSKLVADTIMSYQNNKLQTNQMISLSGSSEDGYVLLVGNKRLRKIQIKDNSQAQLENPIWLSTLNNIQLIENGLVLSNFIITDLDVTILET